MDNVPIYYGNNSSLGRDKLMELLLSPPMGIVGFDTETVSVEDKTLVGLAVSPTPYDAFWFPADSGYIDIINRILLDDTIIKVIHNAKFDLEVMEQRGIVVDNFQDTMVLAYTLNMPQKLYTLAMELGRIVPQRFLDFNIPKGQTTLDLDKNYILEKCCTDAKLTLQVWDLLSPKRTQSYGIDISIINILRRMEKAGVRLNTDSITDFYYTYKDAVEFDRQMITAKYGCDPNSNMQVGMTLANDGVRLNYTKTGKQFRVDEAVLQNVGHPLAKEVLDYRGNAKVLSTYIEPLLGKERVYTTYNSTRVITGRLSSSNPFNMQNVPEFYRSVFLPDGGCFYDLDASQIELRVIAYQAGCKKMLETFYNGGDIHADTQRRMGIKAGTQMCSTEKDARRLAKIVNFATTYLGGPEVIIEQGRKYGVEISWADAHRFNMEFFGVYPEFREYGVSLKEQIDRYGYVTTMFGRIRRADPFLMADDYKRAKHLKELFNMPTQGTAAEIIKIIMKRGEKHDLRIQVHDELVYDWSAPSPFIAENVVKFPTPLKLSVGPSWAEVKEIG